MYLRGLKLAILSFNAYKMAQSMLGRILYLIFFETVLGINKITPTPYSSTQKIKKFISNDILQNLYLKWWGLASLSFNRYKMAQSLLRRSCFKSYNII